MTPKEKANELSNKFVVKSVFEMSNDELKEERLKAKQCALITVDELIKSLIRYDAYDLCRLTQGQAKEDIEYWQEVKQEIQKL